MKRVLVAIGLLCVFAASAHAVSEWNPVAVKLAKSIAYLTGPDGSCTAWSIDQTRDYAMTAAHCDQKDMLVDNIPAKVVAKDSKKDLLVLEVKGMDKPALHLAKDNPKVGDEVASYGFGLALERPFFRVTHVSDDGLYIPFEGVGGPFILTDTNFIGGQSGAPVVDLSGSVVMIVQMGSNAGFGLGVGAEIMKDKMGRYFERQAKP